MTNEVSTARTAEKHLDGGPIRLRYATRCSGCGQTLQPRTTAHFDRTLKQTFCVEHAPAGEPAPQPTECVAQIAHDSSSVDRVPDARAARAESKSV